MTYIVVQQGIYMQNAYGPFSDLTEAKKRAQELAANDRDDYHSWDVCPIYCDDGTTAPVASYKKDGQRTRYLADREAA